MNAFRLFVVGAVLGALALPSLALAGGWKRQSAASCWGNSNNTYSDVTGMRVTWPNYEWCPYDDDSNIPRTSLTTLNVHGKAADIGGIKVSACVKVWNATGGLNVGYFCGSPVTNANAGVFTIAADRSVWNNPAMVNHFSYLRIEPVSINGGEIWGIYTAF